MLELFLQLMYDMSGEGWIKHFLYGTSELLQYFGPETCLSGNGRHFFLTVRVFEVSRALIFNEETFLSTKSWCDIMAQMWVGHGFEDWHPKENLLDLMTYCSDLRVRAARLLQTLPNLSQHTQYQELQCMATEGICLQKALQGWEATTLSWWSVNSTAKDDQMTLAFIFYNAFAIYLSGIFDYFPYWNERHISTPTISWSEIGERLRNILSMAAQALEQTSLAGILFMFPLRVAGARARTSEQTRAIARMLSDISKRGFVVADTFVVDLKELWASKSISSGGTTQVRDSENF